MTDVLQKANHRLFVVTLVAKGLLGLIQLMTAAAIFAGGGQKLPVITQWLLKAELAEDPNDFIATRIISLVGIAPTSDLAYYTTYFSAHGGLHIAFVIALLDGAAWANHVAIFVLWVFVAYQMFEWAKTSGSNHRSSALPSRRWLHCGRCPEPQARPRRYPPK